MRALSLEREDRESMTAVRYVRPTSRTG
jgi:hypothetical protein